MKLLIAVLLFASSCTHEKHPARCVAFRRINNTNMDTIRGNWTDVHLSAFGNLWGEWDGNDRLLAIDVNYFEILEK